MLNHTRVLCRRPRLIALAGCANMQSIQGDQAVGRARYNQAMVFGQNHQLDRAAQELELAVKADPGIYFACYQLGLVYEAQERKESALVRIEPQPQAAAAGGHGYAVLVGTGSKNKAQGLAASATVVRQ